jgi:iron(III) transport system substrate-binding protein
MRPSLRSTLAAAVSCAAALSFATSARADGKKSELWVYTSIYKEYASTLEAAYEKAHPDVDVQIFQAGSEKIQAKVEAEIVAKKVQADIILTSDPFWSLDLAERGLAWERPGHPAVETNYYSLMVLITHKDFAKDKRPATFEALGKPELKGQVQMGSPLESGTMFSSVAYLSRKYGWDYFAKLRDNKMNATGGNAAVIQKVESGERKVGMVLLENALAAIKRGSPLEIIYPDDGSIPVPSAQVILKDAAHRDEAGRFADFVLGSEGQALLRAGFMYGVDPKAPPPAGAKPLAEVTAKSTPWSAETQKQVGHDAKTIKNKFASLVLE